MIKTIVIDENSNNLNQVSSLIKNLDETEFLGGFSDFNKLKNINLDCVELIIFDIKSKNCDEIIDNIKKVKTQNPNIFFVATSSEIDSNLVDKLKQEKIEELILKPVLDIVLKSCIKKALSDGAKKQKAKTITLFSIKNATGKTTTITNIAYDISKFQNKKVCILDLNTNSSDARDYLGVKNKCSFEQILDNLENIDNNKLLDMITNIQNTKLYFLSVFEENNLLKTFSKEEIIKAITALKNIFDYIFVDMSSIVNKKSLSILNNFDLIILIGLCNLAQVKNIEQSYDLFNKIGYNIERIKLLINRVINDDNDTIEKIETTLDKKVDFQIPNNYLTINDAINRFSFTQETNPQSNIAKAYKKIADEISNIDFNALSDDNKLSDIGIFDLLEKMGE